MSVCHRLAFRQLFLSSVVVPRGPDLANSSFCPTRNKAYDILFEQTGNPAIPRNFNVSSLAHNTSSPVPPAVISIGSSMMGSTWSSLESQELSVAALVQLHAPPDNRREPHRQEHRCQVKSALYMPLSLSVCSMGYFIVKTLRLLNRHNCLSRP